MCRGASCPANQWRLACREDAGDAPPGGVLTPGRVLVRAEHHVAPFAGLWYGEAAQALARNTEFEVPALRRTAARCQQQLVDLGRRVEEARASAVAAAAAYKQARLRSPCYPTPYPRPFCLRCVCSCLVEHRQVSGFADQAGQGGGPRVAYTCIWTGNCTCVLGQRQEGRGREGGGWGKGHVSRMQCAFVSFHRPRQSELFQMDQPGGMR